MGLFRPVAGQLCFTTKWEAWQYLLQFAYLFTYSMEHSPSWQANRSSAKHEIPYILWNLKVHYRIHTIPPPFPILNQIDPVHVLPHFSKVNFNIILPFVPGPSKWPPFLKFPHQNSAVTSPPPIRVTCQDDFQSSLTVPWHDYAWGVVSTLPNPQAGGPPLVGCPRLLIQYIRSYPPCLEAVGSIRNLTTRHAVVTGI